MSLLDRVSHPNRCQPETAALCRDERWIGVLKDHWQLSDTEARRAARSYLSLAVRHRRPIDKLRAVKAACQCLGLREPEILRTVLVVELMLAAAGDDEPLSGTVEVLQRSIAALATEETPEPGSSSQDVDDRLPNDR